MAGKPKKKSRAKQPSKRQRDVFLSDYPYPWCRVLGHDWKAPRHNQLTMERGHVRMTLTCDRCSTKRTDYISLSSGEVEERTYRHPHGYLTEGWGEYVPSRSEWRRSQLRPMVEGKRKLKAVG
jgi:hypothetical protein